MREGPAAGHRSQGYLVKSDTWWGGSAGSGMGGLSCVLSRASLVPCPEKIPYLLECVQPTTEELKVRVKAVLAGQGTLPSLTFMSCVMSCTGTMVGGIGCLEVELMERGHLSWVEQDNGENFCLHEMMRWGIGLSDEVQIKGCTQAYDFSCVSKDNNAACVLLEGSFVHAERLWP